MAKQPQQPQRPKYTAAQRRAYWIGVGICTAKTGEDKGLLRHNDAGIQSSVQAGFRDQVNKGVTSRVTKR